MCCPSSSGATRAGRWGADAAPAARAGALVGPEHTCPCTALPGPTVGPLCLSQDRGASTARRASELLGQEGENQTELAAPGQPCGPRDGGLAADSHMETLAGLLDGGASFEVARGMFEVGTPGERWLGVAGSCWHRSVRRARTARVHPAPADPGCRPHSVPAGPRAHHALALCRVGCPVPIHTPQPCDSRYLCPLPLGCVYPII